MDADVISETLEALSEDRLAHARAKEVRTLRGVRGVPDGEIARVLAAGWKEHRPRLPRDEDALDRLFGTAFEDGLVAIGFLAALVPDAPADVLDIGLGWLTRTDDVVTADALGALVLGPAALATGQGPEALIGPAKAVGREVARRAAVSAGMPFAAAMAEGPSAAALRERVGARAVRFVDAPRPDALAALATAFIRDESPAVRKALRRLVRAWADVDAASLVVWADATKGGLPKMIGDEIARARRRA